MKNQSTLKWLLPIIGLLAVFAAGVSLFYQTPGQPVEYTNHRGETVMLNQKGLYYYDTVSSVAQMQGNDIVTLLLGVPLLAVSAWLSFRGSLRGRLLLAGTLAFVLYTYMSMSFLTAYNALFLVYVALFSLSLIAFILVMLSFDLASLPGRFSERLPRRGIAAVLYAGGSFLLLAWLGRIIPPLLQGIDPILENTTTLVIQALDLGLIVPLCFIGATQLLKRSAWGYLLASVATMKILTMGAAVSTMGVNMALHGVPVTAVELGVFPALTMINAVMAVLLLRSISE